MASKACDVTPNWYNRHVSLIRKKNNFCQKIAYDRWSKPTSRAHLGLEPLSLMSEYTVHPDTQIQREIMKPRAVYSNVLPKHYGIGHGQVTIDVAAQKAQLKKLTKNSI